MPSPSEGLRMLRMRFYVTRSQLDSGIGSPRLFLQGRKPLAVSTRCRRWESVATIRWRGNDAAVP
jgi:hypothetical protein